MKIGILGSGNVGQTLASGFIKHGYEIMIGARSPGKLAEWQAKEGEAGKVGSLAETVEFGEALVLAVKGGSAMETLHGIDASGLSGKIIMDATNPIADLPPENGVLKFFTNLDSSLMEQLQSEFPAAHFVKAFSCIGAHLMVDPQLADGKPTMFICGNEDGAKAQVSEIMFQFGHDVEDMGGVEAARAIEPLCMLWCIPGFRTNNWAHALKMIR
ncbi:NADPH-dependent F420 reductase [Calditrichota bacterium]